MKKLPAILPVLIFLLFIAMPAVARGQGEEEVKEVETIEITYWQYFYETKKETIDQLIRLFEEANPNISVSHQTFPYENYNTKVAASVPAGVGPIQTFHRGSFFYTTKLHEIIFVKSTENIIQN